MQKYKKTFELENDTNHFVNFWVFGYAWQLI